MEGHGGLFFEVGGGHGGGVEWVCGVWPWRQEGDCDGEFGGEEEGEVEEAGPGDCVDMLVGEIGVRESWGRTACVTAGEGLEAVHEFSSTAAVGVLANTRRDHDPIYVEDLAHRIDCKFCNALEVGIAAGEEIWSWFSKQELHALCDQECRCERKSKTHPASVPLPQLPPPNQGLGCASFSGRSWDEYHANEENDGGGRNEHYDGEQPCWNTLVVLEWI